MATKKLGGEFYRPVNKREPTTILEQLRNDAFAASEVDAPTQAARDIFLLTIEQLEPEIKDEYGTGVLESLHKDVLPIYKENATGDAKLFFSFDEALREHIEGGGSDWCRAFIGWMLLWNIAERWMRDVALATLNSWSDEWQEDYEGLRRENRYEWQQLSSNGHASLESHLTVEDLVRRIAPRPGFSYDPFSITRREAQASFKAWQTAVEKRFTAFLDAQDRRAQEIGGKKTPEVRQTAQFEWLVRSQVQGWDDERIARHYDEQTQPKKDFIAEDAVRKSRERLAKRIGLRPRSSRT